MTFLEHLDELRTRLIYCLLYIVAGCLLGMLVANPLLEFLFRPFHAIRVENVEKTIRLRVGADGRTLSSIDTLDRKFLESVSPYRVALYLADTPESDPPDLVLGNALRRPVYTGLTDPMMLFFQASLWAGLLFSLPFVLHQLWLFVAPGLKPGERKAVVPLIALGCLLFPLGASFAYFALGLIMNFLVNFQSGSLEPFLEVYRFVGFELQLMIAFGVVFETPLVVMFLTYIGVLDPRVLRQYRPQAIVVIAFLSAVLTPPDVFSMLLMTVPLTILYEVSIRLSVPLAKRIERERMEQAS